MAAPAFVTVGRTEQDVGPLTVQWPNTNVAVDDIALLFVESANQAVTLSTPAGFVEVTGSPQGTGTAGASAATRLTVFWCRATSTTMASPVVADSGTRQTAFIATFRGCINTGNPWDVTAGGVQASSASVSIPGATTTVADTLIVNALTNALGIGAKTVANIVNASLANLAERGNTQLDGTPTGGATTPLPVGVMGDLNPGFGPGDDQVGNKWGVMQGVPAYSSSFTAINTLIDNADANNVVLCLNLAGNKPQYRDSTGAFSMSLYIQQLQRWQTCAKLTDALTRKRVVVYVVDEPNLNNEISPDQVAQMCAEIKAIWPSALTFVRCTPTLLASGWGGLTKPAAGYPKMDYAWLQYNPTYAKAGTTPAAAIAAEKAVIAANSMNCGLGVSLNLWAGGIQTNIDAVPAAWDTGNNSGPMGYVLGDRDAGPVVVTTLGTPLPSLIVNPNWMKHFADVCAADADVPFLLLWQSATSAASTSTEFAAYYNRSDFVAAFDYAITTGNARTNWNGWRTPK